MLRQASGTLNPGSLQTDGQGHECLPAAAQPHFPYGAEILAWTSVLGNKIHTMAASAAAGQPDPDPPCPSGLRLLSQREYSPHPASVSAFFFFFAPFMLWFLPGGWPRRLGRIIKLCGVQNASEQKTSGWREPGSFRVLLPSCPNQDSKAQRG